MEERKKPHIRSKGDWKRGVEKEEGGGGGLRNGNPPRFLDIDVPAVAQTIDLLRGEA